MLVWQGGHDPPGCDIIHSRHTRQEMRKTFSTYTKKGQQTIKKLTGKTAVIWQGIIYNIVPTNRSNCMIWEKWKSDGVTKKRQSIYSICVCGTLFAINSVKTGTQLIEEILHSCAYGCCVVPCCDLRRGELFPYGILSLFLYSLLLLFRERNLPQSCAGILRAEKIEEKKKKKKSEKKGNRKREREREKGSRFVVLCTSKVSNKRWEKWKIFPAARCGPPPSR